MTIPRYSREDMADAVRLITSLADLGMEQAKVEPVGHTGRHGVTPEPAVRVFVQQLRGWAAMMSEAANRTPTHQELVERIDGQLPREERRIRAAVWLCSIYWDIAVAAVGEDEVRRRRDEEIARIVGAGAQA